MATYKYKRKYQKQIQSLWKPEYNALAHYNGQKYKGVVHEPEYVRVMEVIQKDYNENYLPKTRELRGKGLRRTWFGL
jgi:hypothetical protein